MSWLPLYNAWVVFTAILSLFFWKVGGILLFLSAVFATGVYLFKEVILCNKRYVSGFWLFLFSEVAAFGSLFWVSFWTNDVELGHISDFLELPLWGCFLLIGSSITATAYHHSAGTLGSISLLLLTLFLGGSFVGLQIWELYDCECDLLNSVYHAVCFCTVGLHFTHVVLGLAALTAILLLGSEAVGLYYMNLVVWYWHFVDYIWLFVFSIIYIC